MIFEHILTATVLGFTGGLTPGPIILMSFAEVLRSPTKGLANGRMYLIVAGLTEFFIGLFLVVTASWFQLPNYVFHSIAILGVLMLLYIAFQINKIRTINWGEGKRKIGIGHIIAFMLLNGSLWLFWISVCLPSAYKFGEAVPYGEYFFVIIFEIAMMTALGSLLFAFNSFRSYFSNEKIVRKIFLTLTILITLVACKIAYTEIKYFFPL